MFGVEPLARIVHNDARIEVKVPAAKGKKAYSYFREGGESKAKKPSGGGKKLALIGGGLALAGLGAAAIAMSRKKTEATGTSAPASEPKKTENNTARNVAIATSVAGLGAAAIKIASKKGEKEDLSKYVSESEPAIWTQALDNNADDSISVGGKELTDPKSRQGLVSAIYGSKAKTKRIKDLEKDGIGLRDSKEYFVLELMRNTADNIGRGAPLVMVGKKPPKDATHERVEKYRDAVTSAISGREDIDSGKGYDAFLEYVYGRSYYSRPPRTTR